MKLVIKPQYKINEDVQLVATEYLKYYQSHPALVGKIIGIKSDVHNAYVPEYVVLTEQGELLIPEYSFMTIKTEIKATRHKKIKVAIDKYRQHDFEKAESILLF